MRRAVFVINNPTEVDMKLLQQLPENKLFRYVVWQGEYASTGTKHIQGYVELLRNERMDTYKKLLGERVHLEVPFANSSVNTHYCMKPIKGCKCAHCVTALARWHDPVVKGQPATVTQDELWQMIVDQIDEGKSNLELIQEYPRLAKEIRTLNEYREEKLMLKGLQKWRPIRALWLYGTTGVGKTFAPISHFEDLYMVASEGYPFDNYRGEKAILIDDFCSEFKLHTLLRMTDCYKYQLTCRYFNKWAQWNDVIFTSNLHHNEIYVEPQLARRLQTVKVYMFAGSRMFLHEETNQVYTSFADLVSAIPYRVPTPP